MKKKKNVCTLCSQNEIKNNQKMCEFVLVMYKYFRESWKSVIL